MKKSILLISLLSGTALMLPNGAIAYDISTLTHTPKPKPSFEFVQLDKAYKTAGICFLGVGDCAPEVGFSSGGDDDGDYDVNTGNQCLNEGFSKQSCNSVQTIDGVCPYNSAYGRGCKCVSNLISCPAGQVGVGDSCDGKYASCKCDPNLKTCSSKEVGQGASCGGRYESCVCKSEYQYTSSNCTYPRSVSGDNCSGKYTNCVCPTGVSSTPYGCEEYYPAPCSSVCKIAYADNCRNRDSVSTPYGCVEYWSDCSSKCKTAYNDNCRNRTAATCQFGCASSFADCQSKCEKCKTDNCDNRTNQSCQYGCQTYWSDCSSKCQTCYADNCRNRTAVIASCPANATCQYFSDCPSKISSWSCNSGYNQSGNSCIQACRPYADQVNCKFGTQSCSDGCGGTRTCCKPCPYQDLSSYCSYGSCPFGGYTITDQCGTNCTACPAITCPDRGYMDSSYGYFPSNCSKWEYCPLSSAYKKCLY